MIDVEKQTSSVVEEDRPDGVGMMLVGRVGEHIHHPRCVVANL